MSYNLENSIPDRFDTKTDFWENAYPADIADLINEVPDDKINKVVNKLSTETLGRVTGLLDIEKQEYIARYFSAKRLSNVLTYMYPDDAADFLGTIPVGKVKEILNKLKDNQAEELQRLLEYDEESAGGIMTPQFIAFYTDQKVERVIKKLRKLVSEPEMIYYLYVISRDKELVGVLSVRQLLAADSEEKLSNIMTENVIKARTNQDQEEVAHILSKYDLLAVPVVNKRDQLMGIITVDDAIDVIEEEATEDIYKMAATSNIYEHEGIMTAVKKRIPWLFILLIGDLLSGTVIKGFEDSLQAVVALAIFIPVLMDMGGNAGTQSLTVVVRGLATGNLSFSNFGRHLLQEVKVGFIMAAVLGLSLTLITFLWQGNATLGIVVGVSMFATLLTAVTVGTSIPFIINSLGADPAIAAGPFITTLIDITGLFIYFSMATLLLENLL